MEQKFLDIMSDVSLRLNDYLPSAFTTDPEGFRINGGHPDLNMPRAGITKITQAITKLMKAYDSHQIMSDIQKIDTLGELKGLCLSLQTITSDISHSYTMLFSLDFNLPLCVQWNYLYAELECIDEVLDYLLDN